MPQVRAFNVAFLLPSVAITITCECFQPPSEIRHCSSILPIVCANCPVDHLLLLEIFFPQSELTSDALGFFVDKGLGNRRLVFVIAVKLPSLSIYGYLRISLPSV